MINDWSIYIEELCKELSITSLEYHSNWYGVYLDDEVFYISKYYNSIKSSFKNQIELKILSLEEAERRLRKFVKLRNFA